MPGEKILVIEDSPELLSFLAGDLLPYYGYRVVATATGREGLRKLQSDKPDLLLLDLDLPDISGMDVLRAMRGSGSDIPAILMTAYGSESIAVEAFRLGARDYLIKPFTTEEVIGVIEQILGETRLRREKEQLTRSLQQRVRQLNILSAVGRSVVSLKDLDELLSRIVEAGVYITGAEHGFLLLVDPETKELYLRAEANLTESQAQGFRLKVEDSLAGQVVKTGKAMRWGGEGTRRDFKVKTGYLVKSLIHVPLVLREKVIGVLSVDNQASEREFSEDDQYVLSILAGYAAIGIENATLQDELRESLDALKRSQQELIESSKLAAVGTLAAAIAHDFNNLLTSVSGHAQLGLISDDAEDIRQALRVVVDSCDRAQNITTHLLAFTRGREPSIEMADVTEAVQSPLLLMERQLQESNIKLVRRFSEIRPTIFDPAQISQVCLHLLINARDAMLPEGGTLTVEIREDQDDVTIAFSDTGGGIPEHMVDNLFEPFMRTKGALESGDMTGASPRLSVAYGIVKNHGGTIEVETQPGEGSTFTVRLPIKGVEDLAEREAVG